VRVKNLTPRKTAFRVRVKNLTPRKTAFARSLFAATRGVPVGAESLRPPAEGTRDVSE